jgi:hypothetical protein
VARPVPPAGVWAAVTGRSAAGHGSGQELVRRTCGRPGATLLQAGRCSCPDPISLIPVLRRIAIAVMARPVPPASVWRPIPPLRSGAWVGVRTPTEPSDGVAAVGLTQTAAGPERSTLGPHPNAACTLRPKSGSRCDGAHRHRTKTVRRRHCSGIMRHKDRREQDRFNVKRSRPNMFRGRNRSPAWQRVPDRRRGTGSPAPRRRRYCPARRSGRRRPSSRALPGRAQR